jgi:hypothetical protein
VSSASGTASTATPARGNRIKTLFRRSRTLVRVAYRDPQNVPERLALGLVERLAEPSRAWARDALASEPDLGPVGLTRRLRSRSAKVARIDGAIAGTPFFIALVPGYVGYLWQEARMTLRTAALFGREPGELRSAAELLALRGVHQTVEAAEAALSSVLEKPLPEKPERRRSLRTWVGSIRMLLVLGGFVKGRAMGEERRSRGRLLAGVFLLAGAAVWVATWVFPVSLMIVMAWTCERDMRELGRRAEAYYSGEATSLPTAIRLADARTDSGHGVRQLLRSLGLLGSIAVPVAFVAVADHVRNTTGINWIAALGALVAVSVVIAAAVVARGR